MLLRISFFIGCLWLSGCGFYQDVPIDQLKSLYTNQQSKFIDVDGMAVHYRIEGQGPELVLLHGSSASLHTWQGWVDALKDSYTLISLDLPGHGLTGPHPDNKYDSVSTAQFVDHFAMALGLESFALAGNSRGGNIAWNYAVLNPSKVSALILVDAAGVPSDEDIPAIFKLYQISVLKGLLSVFTPQFMVRNSIEDVYGDPSKVTTPMVQQYHDLLLRQGNRQATVERFDPVQINNLFSRITEIKAPTLILWGAKDTWILPKYAARFAELIEGSEVIMYPTLGHVPMEEAPLKTANDVRAFLQK